MPVIATLSPLFRLEEDDERMKAIREGKSVVEKMYSNLESNISTEGGSLDIGKLADPNAGSGDDNPPPPAPQKVGSGWWCSCCAVGTSL